MNGNEFTAKNNRIAAAVRAGAEFEIIHKDRTHLENEPDGYWVSNSDTSSKVGYYDMVLVDMAVEDLREMGCSTWFNYVLVERSTKAYDLMVSSWIPLPVLFEALGLYHNFKEYNDLSYSRAVEMIMSKLVVVESNYHPCRLKGVKKCGRIVAV